METSAVNGAQFVAWLSAWLQTYTNLYNTNKTQSVIIAWWMNLYFWYILLLGLF